jgi:hypothetical protein
MRPAALCTRLRACSVEGEDEPARRGELVGAVSGATPEIEDRSGCEERSGKPVRSAMPREIGPVERAPVVEALSRWRSRPPSPA